MEQADLEVPGGGGATGQGRGGGGRGGGGGGGGGGIRRDPAMRGRIRRHGRGALFRGHSIGSGDVRYGSPEIEEEGHGEVVPDSEEEEGHVEVPDSEEEEEGHTVVPDSIEEGGHVEVPDSEEEEEDDIPDAIASTLDAMEEQYRDVALSMYRICFSTFFKNQ